VSGGGNEREKRESLKQKQPKKFYDKVCHSSSRSLYKQSEQNKLKLREHFLCFSLTEAALLHFHSDEEEQ
jgi:hypothetical protein